MYCLEDIETILDYLPIRLYMFMMWDECLCQCFANLMSFGKVFSHSQIVITLLSNEVSQFGFGYFLEQIWVHCGEDLVNLCHVLVYSLQDR